MTEGQKLRLAGRGETGAGGGAAGDLYLRVRLAKHPDFEVEGHNLIYEAELAPWEAVLGAKISVPTLDGRVNIKIPAGTQSGQKLRVRGRGLPVRDGARGDLIVVTKIAVPVQSLGHGEKIVGTTRARIEIQSARLNVAALVKARSLNRRAIRTLTSAAASRQAMPANQKLFSSLAFRADLGRAMAEEFIRLGHTVLGCGRSEKETATIAKTISRAQRFHRRRCCRGRTGGGLGKTGFEIPGRAGFAVEQRRDSSTATRRSGRSAQGNFPT